MLTDHEKVRVLRSLKRIEGQVRGIAAMIDEEKYCVDVLTQIAATHEALRTVGRKVVENHLATCVQDATLGADAAERTAKYQEFVETIYKFIR